MVVRPPWTIFRVSRTPLSRLSFLRPAEFSRSLIVSLPAALATPVPVATTTGLPLRPNAFAGTVAEIVTLPAAPTVSLTGRPAPSALVVTLDGRLATGAATMGTGGGVVVTGGLTGGAGGGRNAAMFAPPIEALLPVGEISTGGDEKSHGSAAVAGVPATFRPWASVQAIWRPSWESETSVAMPTVCR